MQVNIYEAKSKLSALLELAQQGRDVIIAKSGRPIARLVPIDMENNTRSGVRFGLLKNSEIAISDDFHQPFTDADLLG